MSEEREYAKHVDELILNASADELLEIQKLDMETQLDGNSFYEIHATKRKANHKRISPKVHSSKKS